MWSATIKGFLDNPVPNDTRTMTVTFTDGQRTFDKSFKITASNFPDQASIEAFVQQELASVQNIYALDEVLANQDPINVVPQRVTNFQARAVMIGIGVFAQVNALVAAMGSDTVEYQAWEYANHVYRNSPLVNAIAAQLGMTSEDMDNLFVQAAAIEA